MVNCGEEKVRVHMNVVPRSTMNTNVAKMVLSNNQMWRFWLYQITKNTRLVLSNNQCETRLVSSNNQEKQNWFYQITKGNKTGYMK